MARDPFDRPCQRRRRCLVTGGQQGQQFVADLAARHRRTVFVGAAQEQRQHVGAVLEVGIVLRPTDQRVDERFVFAAVLDQSSPPWRPGQFALRRGQHRQPRSQGHPLRDELAQSLEFETVSPEDGSQDDVQRNMHHRFERFEFRSLRPGFDLAQRLLDHDLLVGPDALAVKRRGEQLAPHPVLDAIESEHRSGSQQPAQVRLDVVEDVGGARGEDLLGQRRVGDHDGVAEHRYPHREAAPVASGHPVGRGPAGQHECQADQRIRQPPRGGRQLRIDADRRFDGWRFAHRWGPPGIRVVLRCTTGL